MTTNSTHHFDAIIVGSGPGGGTVARELSLRGKKPLILEWGGNAPLKGSLLQSVDILGIPGKGLLFTKEGLAMARGITTGGSSVAYCGTAFEPAHDMFKRYGVDITAETREARDELPIGPLDDKLIAPQTKLMMKSAQDLGYDWKKIDKYVYQDKCEPGCYKCYFGCPHGAKWSSRMYVEEAVQNGGQLVVRAKVRKVLVENNRAVGVLYTKGGVEHKVFAPLVIVSAGGIGTPMVLRETGITEAGHDFFFDPLFVTLGTVSGIDGTGEMPMSTGIHIEEEGYMMTDMTLHQAMYSAFSAQAFRFDRLGAHKKTLGIMIKAKDSLGGHITKRGNVDKRLAKSDRAKLMRGYERAKKILENAGAKNIYKTWEIAAHPGGTAKLGEVVDSNLQTRYDNLYVCDCSVIPEAWGLPPTLSLISLGKRLAKHLTA